MFIPLERIRYGLSVWGAKKKSEWECFLDDLRAVGINADQWTTAAQDEGGWRRTAEQGAEHFMVKSIVAEKAKVGQLHAVVSPNVTGRTKERIAHRKRARAGSLALLLCLVFVFMLSLKPRPFVQSSFDMQTSR